eukprot:6173579-Pleurochrysis_carterae.AAC.1
MSLWYRLTLVQCQRCPRCCWGTTIALAWRAMTNQTADNWTQSAAVRRGVQKTPRTGLCADAASSLPHAPPPPCAHRRVRAVRGAVD